MQNQLVFLGCALFVSAGLALAASTDVPGSKDHPLVKRYEGAVIMQYDQKAYADYTIPLGKAVDARQLGNVTRVEGEVTRLTYKVPVGRSPLEVVRNYENALQAAGYETLFSGAKEELGQGFVEAAGYHTLKFAANIPDIPAFTFNADTQRFWAAKRTRPEGDVHVALYAVENHYWAVWLTALGLEKGQTLLQVDIIMSKPMESKMVTVAAAEMAQKITDTGRIALYGIYFDFNKTDVKAASEPTLEQVAKLLKGHSALKLLVVGHTDNVGTLAFNLDLSQRRAAAVVHVLVARFGIDKHRVAPVGVSFASPIASNQTEEGRAKNRRVELVEN